MTPRSSHNEYLLSPHWRSFRREHLSPECVKCQSPRNLHLHHKTYVRKGRERASDVVTLCERCHSRLHQLQRDKKLSVQQASKRFLGDLGRVRKKPRAEPQVQGPSKKLVRRRVKRFGGKIVRLKPSD